MNVDTDYLSHAECYSDGAVFYIGGTPEHPNHLFVHETHNLARKLPLDRAEDRAAVMGAIEATFHDPRLWRKVDLDSWCEDDTMANYQADASLVAVYVYVPRDKVLP